MKKFFKYTFITILCSVVIILVIFRNRIMLTYNLVHYVVSLKDNTVSYSINNMETLKTMDHKNIIYKKAISGGFALKNPSKYLLEYLSLQGINLPVDTFGIEQS